jgi:hypothetical protein
MYVQRNFKILVILVTLAYPLLSVGQAADSEQLATDQAACQQHAIAYSGHNPAASTAEQADTPPPQRGAGLRGAARGAAKGAAAGGIVEHVGGNPQHDNATEVGAALGTASGAVKGRRSARTQAAANPPPPAPVGDASAYAKSYDECMSGKGHK